MTWGCITIYTTTVIVFKIKVISIILFKWTVECVLSAESILTSPPRLMLLIIVVFPLWMFGLFALFTFVITLTGRRRRRRWGRRWRRWRWTVFILSTHDKLGLGVLFLFFYLFELLLLQKKKSPSKLATN